LKNDRIVLRCNRHFVAAPPWISRVTIMRTLSVLIVLALMVSAAARADRPKVAGFASNWLILASRAKWDGPRRDEQGRLMRAGDQLRTALVESDKFVLLDIAPVDAAAHGINCRPVEAAMSNMRNDSLLISSGVFSN